MTPMTTPEGPTIHVDLASVMVVSPIKFQTQGPTGPVPALGTPRGAMLIGAGWNVAVVGEADHIAKQVERAKKGPLALLNA